MPVSLLSFDISDDAYHVLFYVSSILFLWIVVILNSVFQSCLCKCSWRCRLTFDGLSLTSYKSQMYVEQYDRVLHIILYHISAII